MNKKKNVSSFNWVLLRISVAPIFILTLIITSFSTKRFVTSMNHEVKQELQDLCDTILTMYDSVYSGDYSMLEQDGAIYFYKGQHLLNGNFSIIDEIKARTDVDITFYYQDTRVITTLFDENNVRLVGTKASTIIVRDVIEGKNVSFYPSVDVEGRKFFAFYSPLYNKDGSCIGMIFVGKPSAEVEKLVSDSIMPILYISLFAMLITGIISMRYSKQLSGIIKKTETFLEKVSNGNLHAEFDPLILKRNDELGEMGRYIVKMQRALRELVEQDILTGLYNRRCAEKLLKQTQHNYRKFNEAYCIAIGDIDFFKKVNDTYGHECGDAVLADISLRLRKHMKGNGFVARWGGEEFLLVFSELTVEQSVQKLEGLLQDIRDNAVIYNEDTIVKVTMTFGITQGTEEKLDDIIKEADEKLYFGKNNGRNQIVHEI